MDKKDLAQIKVVVTESMNEVLEHVVMPQFDLLHERIDMVEHRLDRVESTLGSVEKKIDTQLVSKGFLEDSLDNFRIDHGLTYRPAT